MTLVIGLAVVAIVIGAILPTGLGTLANSSSGSAMVNVDPSAVALYNQLPIFLVIGIVLAIVGAVFVVFKGR